MTAPTIVLIGARASGKTSLGRQLADRLGRPFIDLDHRVLAHLGVTDVHEAWSRGGEAGWRAAEASLLDDLLDEGGAVLALGGGTPMVPGCRASLERRRDAGMVTVVYLECPPEELARRLRAEPGDRPSLTGADPADEIAGVLAEREATYHAIADVVFEAWGADQEALVERLAAVAS